MSGDGATSDLEAMPGLGAGGDDPHVAIERLEAEIDALGDRIEGCRKFILAGRIAVLAGGLVLMALLFGLIRFDPMVMAGAAAALLGGFVVYGSNTSTAQEAAAALADAEAERAALIGRMELRVVSERPTLH